MCGRQEWKILSFSGGFVSLWATNNFLLWSKCRNQYLGLFFFSNRFSTVRNSHPPVFTNKVAVPLGGGLGLQKVRMRLLGDVVGAFVGFELLLVSHSLTPPLSRRPPATTPCGQRCRKARLVLERSQFGGGEAIDLSVKIPPSASLHHPP